MFIKAIIVVWEALHKYLSAAELKRYTKSFRLAPLSALPIQQSESEENVSGFSQNNTELLRKYLRKDYSFSVLRYLVRKKVPLVFKKASANIYFAKAKQR